MKTIYIVLPCYNEDEVLPETSAQLSKKMHSLIGNKIISPESKVIFVDDGSSDNTWRLIEGFHLNDPLFGGIKLSRNQGHQNALLSGLMTVKKDCDAVISMDADLQDNLLVIDKMIEEFEKGFDIVYGVRNKRETDSFFKRTSAQLFYKSMNSIGAKTIYNHADCRLMNQRALYALEEFKEVNLFLRGIVPLIGYKSTQVLYDRDKRFAGETKYPLKKMLNFAWNGITSFSVKPIKLISFLGLLLFLGGLSALVGLAAAKLGGAYSGSASIIISAIFTACGIQLIAIGIIGEYIGKIHSEVKNRPRYIIETYLH